jgi:hypothetical protein
MTDFDPDAYLQDSSQATSFDPDAYLADDSPKAVKSYDAVNGKLVPTGSPEAKAAQSPTAGMSGYQKFMAGAGKSQIDTARGIGQLVGIEPQTDVDAAKARDVPLMQSGAAVAGDIAGNVADVVIPAGLAGQGLRAAGLARTGAVVGGLANPTTFTGAAASGALQGALQPTATGESRTQNAVVGAGSGLVGQGLARGGSAIVNAMAPEAAANKAVSALTQAGVPLDAAQRTGSTLLNRAKIMLSDNPLTAGAQADFADMQQKAVNRAFLSTIGETANAATPDVMSRAMARMGNVYDDVASRVSIPYDKVETPLADIMNNARLTLNDSQFGTISRNADDILQKASQNGGVINGPQFQNIKKTLDSLSSSGDSDVASVARDMRQALHDGLYQSAVDSGNTADAMALKQTNQQWRNMRTIEGAIDKQGNGDISPARLANIMGQKANRNVSIYGKGDTSLSDLAQSANALLPQKVPNSGTASRLIAQVGLPMAAGAGIEGVREGDWQGAAKGAVGGVLLPYAIQKAINSPGALGKIASSAGALTKPSTLPLYAGGVLQHAPLSSLLGLKQRLDNPNSQAAEQANKPEGSQ